MAKFFISHSSHDDAFVRELRTALADHGLDGWIDSRELRGGDLLWLRIWWAMLKASAYIVVVSTDALQSKWVGKELRHALRLQTWLGRNRFPIIPLSLDGTKLGVLEEFFGKEPVYVPVSSSPGGIESAMNDILVALGKRLPADIASTPQTGPEPLEDLILELTDLRIQDHEEIRRASARARLIYKPATDGQPDVHSVKQWLLVAPIGPIEADDLRWYLEEYPFWPSGADVIQQRAQRVERCLPEWGQLLYEAVMPAEYTINVTAAWARIDGKAGRRFSVLINTTLDAGLSEAEIQSAKESCTALLTLPWELLHDGKSYLFQGAHPTGVRRRLPSTESLDVPVVATPIRILIVTARPEDATCCYIDHRVSVMPLVRAMEALPGLVEIKVLTPPTLPALRDELDRAYSDKRPYQVVHFDGHGVYDRDVGRGGLCFEHPDDVAKLEGRRHQTIYTDTLGPLLRDHRIPLVFLEACQSAVAERTSESVASELLKVGVASVIAMSHSVLVETSRRFAAAFYGTLAEGKRIGCAMLAGQRALKDDTSRGPRVGNHVLQLEDWCVPVLFQEKEDPQLVATRPNRQTLEDFKIALAARLGALPPEPKTGFIGRSRSLLALQRLLWREDGGGYAVICGQAGEGKTALAAELARWLVRSHQVRRSAFVSLALSGDKRAIVDALGRQLTGPFFSLSRDLEADIQEVERSLRERLTLLVIDNMESVLLPPFLAQETPLAETAGRRADCAAILDLCERLLKSGDTKLVFTSREPLPAPFDAERRCHELRWLDHGDAVKLIERTLEAFGTNTGTPDKGARDAIEALVDATRGNAHALTLLTPTLQHHNMAVTRETVVEQMMKMEQRFPGNRERSMFASVEFSLRRLSVDNLERARLLGVFHGGVQLGVLRRMLDLADLDVNSLSQDLVQTGLATSGAYGYLALNPGLCPFLRTQLDDAEREVLTARWIEEMRRYVEYLYENLGRDTAMASTLVRQELPNLFALVESLQEAGDAAAVVDLTTRLGTLLLRLGKWQLVERVGKVRDAAAKTLGEHWNHLTFEAQRTNLEQQQLANSDLTAVLGGAVILLKRARAAGEDAYPEAAYDLALACCLVGQISKAYGRSEQALPLLAEAQERFERLVKDQRDQRAARMASVCISEQGECLWRLGRYDEAVVTYEESITRADQLRDERQVAVNKSNLGNVRLLQGRHAEALKIFAKALDVFDRLDDPGAVAGYWHQISMAYLSAGQAQYAIPAEEAARRALQIWWQIDNVAGQADALNQLGNVYVLNRPEEAAVCYRQAVDKYMAIGNRAKEGMARSNLAAVLRRLGRLDSGRQEIGRAIACKDAYGHQSEPWKTWDILSDIETDAGRWEEAARAKRNAVEVFLAFRRDGGENPPDGPLASAIADLLLNGNPAAAAKAIQELNAHPNTPDRGRAFLHALRAIASGSRDRALADSPELCYRSAAEVLLLIEQLKKTDG